MGWEVVLEGCRVAGVVSELAGMGYEVVGEGCRVAGVG